MPAREKRIRPEPAPTPAPEPADYTIGKWGEYDNYRCRLCPFDTLDRAVIEAHVEAHKPPPPPPVYTPVILDRWGNPLNPPGEEEA